MSCMQCIAKLANEKKCYRCGDHYVSNEAKMRGLPTGEQNVAILRTNFECCPIEMKILQIVP